MNRLWLFFHLLGMALWIGGAFTLSLFTVRARATGDARITAFAYAAARRLYRGLISVGAWVTIVSGAILMFAIGQPWFRPFPEHWLFQMQIVGLIAFLATVAFLVPNATAIAALAEADDSSAELRARVKKQALVGSVTGVALIYLILLGALRF